ncbi:phage tail domain-containing protein [Streptomyces sp. SID5910]|uniref:phage distal tail protein n=1 Tax=Streptomyces sp. SID5910 TaxID=2690312 RepID=UPI00192755CF
MAAGDLVTRPGHIQYGPLLLGPGTPYRWKTLSGWGDLPGLDSGTVARSDAHGSFPGRLLAQARTVTVEGLMIRAPRGSIGAAVGALEAGTVPVEDELPLVVWLDERGPLLAYARATRRLIPTGPGYRVGSIQEAAVEWEATDPRRYELVERSDSARLPMPEQGLDWHTSAETGTDTGLDWHTGAGADGGLAFGEPGRTGALSVMNAGSAATHPLIEFRGPVVRPSLTNLATGDVLEYDLPLAAGDVLTVDTRAGTVTLNETASRLSTATARSVPEQTWTLAPGELVGGVLMPTTTPLIFRAAPGSTDPAASVTLRWRSAYF